MPIQKSIFRSISIWCENNSNRPTPLFIVLFTGIFFCLLASRRLQQLLTPQVWDEDGSRILYGFINEGVTSFLEPVNGYLITIPKVISFASLSISISQYHYISTVIAWLFIILIGLAIIMAPTYLKNRVACAIAVFLIPSNPEVFGIPLYTFWWAALLLFLIALWDKSDVSIGWRIAFLLIGGLSSPVVIMVLPIFFIRAWWYRSQRSELIIAFIATFIALLQLFFIYTRSAATIPMVQSVLNSVVISFFGKFLIGNWIHNLIVVGFMGFVLISIIIAWFLQNRDLISNWILLYLLIGSLATTILRIDPAIIDPSLAGPRYFFYTFILIFWILIQYFHSSNSHVIRCLVLLIVVIALINAAPTWSRQHDDLQWTSHICRCCQIEEEYIIPIQFDGSKKNNWSITISGEKCREYLRKDLFPSCYHDNISRLLN